MVITVMVITVTVEMVVVTVTVAAPESVIFLSNGKRKSSDTKMRFCRTE